MILTNAVILSLIVYFIHVCFYWEGMVFEKAGTAFSEGAPEWLSKPFLFACPICSTPWWGFVFYKVMHKHGVAGFNDWRTTTIIATLFTAAGIAVLLVIASKFFSVLKLLEDKYEQEQNSL